MRLKDIKEARPKRLTTYTQFVLPEKVKTTAEQCSKESSLPSPHPWIRIAPPSKPDNVEWLSQVFKGGGVGAVLGERIVVWTGPRLWL